MILFMPMLVGPTLTHVVEPAGDLAVHLVTRSHSDGQHDFGDEASEPRHLLDPHHELLQRQSQLHEYTLKGEELPHAHQPGFKQRARTPSGASGS